LINDLHIEIQIFANLLMKNLFNPLTISIFGIIFGIKPYTE